MAKHHPDLDLSGLVIGDRPIDIKAGQAAGLDTHLFTSIVNLRQVLDM